MPGTHGKEKFVVNNYEGAYTGSNTLAGALTVSDNSIYAELGIKVGTRRIASLAERMGIRTPVSHNLAMTLGGLKQGVTPLDMAHAYDDVRRRTAASRSAATASARPTSGPVGIHEIKDANGDDRGQEHAALRRRDPARAGGRRDADGHGERGHLGHRQAGRHRRASRPGKTGTTENYGDAWFVGYNEHYTVAVWVGYPHGLKPMKTEFNGGPVAGGTFPAEIWRDFMAQAAARSIDQRHARQGAVDHDAPSTPQYTTPAPADSATYTDSGPGDADPDPDPDARTPTPTPTPTPTADPDAHPDAGPRPRRPPPAPAGPAATGRRRHRARGSSRRYGPPRAAAARRHGLPGRAEAPGQLDALGDPDPRRRRPAAAGAARAAAGRSRSGRRRGLWRSLESSMPSAWVSLPGPEHRSRGAARPRRSRMSSRPWVGSSARIRTAAPDVLAARRPR